MKKLTVLLSVILCFCTLLCSCGESAVTTDTTKDTVSTQDFSSADMTTQTTAVSTAATTISVIQPGLELPDIAPGTAVRIELDFNKKTVVSAGKTFGKKLGNLDTLSGWKSSDFVSIGSCYGFSYELPATANLISIALFDKDRKYITGVGTSSNTSAATTVQGFIESPENAAFVRILHYSGTSAMPEFKTSTLIAYGDKETFESAKSTRKYNDLVIACIGDSLTEGDYAGTPGVANRQFETYPYFLSKALGCTTVNYGKCGASIQVILNNITAGEINIAEADVILLMIGTNRGLDGSYESYYRSAISNIRNKMKDGAVLVLVTPPTTTNSVHTDFVKSAYTKAKSISKELGLPLIDVYSGSPIQPENAEKYQPADGLHLNEEGYKALAEFIAAELEVILEKLK